MDTPRGGNEDTINASDATVAAVASLHQPAEASSEMSAGSSVIIRLIDDPTLAARIQAHELEEIFCEVQGCLQLFTTPLDELVETYGFSNDKFEPDVRAQERFIFSIKEVDDILSKHRNDGGALVMYFRRSICTPKNLQALLSILDPDIRTDRVRSMTFWLLEHLTDQSGCSIWNEKLSNGLRFATDYLYQCAKSLERRADDEDDIINGRDIVFIMKLCLDFSKDAPIEVLNRISSLDWSAILESERAGHDLYLEVVTLFYDRSNFDMRKPEFAPMLESFGRCFGLLRRVLKQILQLRSLNESSSPEEIFDTLHWTHRLDEFWYFFYATMSGPPPREIERELDVLFSCVHSTLVDARPYILSSTGISTSDGFSTPWLTVETYDDLMHSTQPDTWTAMKALPVSGREKLRKDMTGNEGRRSRKDVRRFNRLFFEQKVQTVPTTGGNELCVNCLQTERDLLMACNDGRLLKCSLCKEVSYCSRSCQREHWKRFHRSNCAGNTGKNK